MAFSSPSTPAKPNADNIMATLRRMRDDELLQYAQLHKNDPYIFPLTFQESNSRKQMRAEQAAQDTPTTQVVDKNLQEMAAPAPQMAQGMPPQGMPPQGMPPQGMPQGMPPHQLPEDSGIGQLPAPNMQRMATGGIVAFEEGGEVPGYAGGGAVDPKQKFTQQYYGAAVLAGQELGVDPGIILSQWGLETGWGKSKSAVGANNLGNIKAGANWKGPTIVQHDKAENSKDAYRQYDSPEAFAKDYVELIKSKYPGSVGAGKDATKFVAGLRPGEQGGYATDKNYASSFLKTASRFVPVASAQAAEPGRPTAPSGPSLVDRIPGQTGAVPEPARTKPLTGNEMVTGAGETALQYGTGLLSLPFAAAAGAIKPGVPFEQAFSEAHKGMTYSPRTAGGQEISEATSKALSGLPAIIPGATTAGMARGPLKNFPASTTAAREALSKSEQARAPRLPYEKPPTPVSAAPEGLTPEAMATRDAAVKQRQAREQAARAQGQQASMERQTQDITAADDALAAASARAAGDRAGLETLKKETDYTQGASNRAQNIATGAVAGAAGAGAPGVGAAGGLPDMAKAMNIDEESRVIQQAPPEMDPKDIKKIGKEATPKDERKGMSGEDFLMIGLGILSGQSPNALTNIGEGGLKGLQMAQAGRKIASEEAYHKGMLERYATPQALQMALAYNDPEKRRAIEDYVRMEAQTKAEPMTKQKLFQEFMKSPAGQVGEFDKFDTYMQQWENRFGPIGGGSPKGTVVTRIGQ